MERSVPLLPEVDSTNGLLKKACRCGAPPRTWPVRHQTGGMAGGAGAFFSPPGMGLYLSHSSSPECPPARLMHSDLCRGVAMCDAMRKVLDSAQH